jgi:hypothetical protein
MKELIDSLDDFTWENYKDISDALVRFTDINVETEITRQASIYSYYHGLMCVAKKQTNDLTNELTRFMATIRKEAKQNSSVKLTAKDLDDMVMSEEGYVTRQKDLDDALLKYELLKGLVKSLEQKKDMLIQASANKREETKLYK